NVLSHVDHRLLGADRRLLGDLRRRRECRARRRRRGGGRQGRAVLTQLADPPVRAAGPDAGTARSRVIGHVRVAGPTVADHRRPGENLAVLGTVGIEAVVLRPDETFQPVALLQPGPRVDPRRRVADDQVVLYGVAVVVVADQRAFGLGDRRQAPVDGDGLVVDAVHRVLAGALVVDLLTVLAQLAGLESDLAEDGVGPEERDVHALVARLSGRVAHLGRPVLIVAKGEQGLVVQQLPASLVEVDVGPVGDVQPQRFDKRDQRKLIAEEVARPLTHCVGTVERHNSRPVLEVRAVVAGLPLIEVVAAPQVVRLPRGHRVLNDEGGRAAIVSDRERHVVLHAGITDQLEEVDTWREGRRQLDRERRRPRRGDHVGLVVALSGGLLLARKLRRLPHEPATESAVVADPVCLDVVARLLGRDEQPDGIARLRAHLVGVALELAVLSRVADAPVGGARLGVLRLDPLGPDALDGTGAAGGTGVVHVHLAELGLGLGRGRRGRAGWPRQPPSHSRPYRYQGGHHHQDNPASVHRGERLPTGTAPPAAPNAHVRYVSPSWTGVPVWRDPHGERETHS